MTILSDITEYTLDASNRKQVNFPAGAKRVHRIDVEDSAGAPQTMTGWSLSYVWRVQVTGELAFSKATGGSGITIGNGSGTDDRATVTIDRADTVNLEGTVYDWALWRTDGTDDDLLAGGTLVLAQLADQA